MTRQTPPPAHRFDDWSDIRVIVIGLGISMLMIGAVVLSAAVSAVLV